MSPQVFCAAWKPVKRHCILLHVLNRKTVLHVPGNGDDSGVWASAPIDMQCGLQCSSTWGRQTKLASELLACKECCENKIKETRHNFPDTSDVSWLKKLFVLFTELRLQSVSQCLRNCPETAQHNSKGGCICCICQAGMDSTDRFQQNLRLSHAWTSLNPTQ